MHYTANAGESLRAVGARQAAELLLFHGLGSRIVLGAAPPFLIGKAGVVDLGASSSSRALIHPKIRAFRLLFSSSIDTLG
jgi:hypothetical protein